jgi:linoleoyl-CoA desaturase
VYQAEATKDFAPASRLANFLFGGLNTHLIHHLFPRVCHIHYPALTRFLREAAAESGVPYHNESFLAAIAAHWRFLRAMGRQARPGVM